MSEKEPETYDPKGMRLLRFGLAVFVVLLVLAIFPFSADPSGDIKRFITAWAAALLAVISLLYPDTGRARSRRLFMPFLLVLLILYVLSITVSPNPGHSLVVVTRLAALLLLYQLACWAFRTPRQVNTLLIVVFAAVTAASLYGFCQRVGWDPFPWDAAQMAMEEYRNLPATFGNPNLAGHVLVMGVVIGAYLATRRRTLWCAPLLAPVLLHLYLTRERAGILALFAALILTAAALTARRFSRTAPAKQVTMTLVGFTVVLVASAAFAAGAFMWLTGAAYPRDLSMLQRYNSLYSASQMLVDRPVLGWGPGSYEIANTPYWTTFEQWWYATQSRLNSHAHCDLLEWAIECGLPGAAACLGLLLAGICFALHEYFRTQNAARRRLGLMFAALFAAFLTDGLFGFNSRAPVSAGLLFLMLGTFEGMSVPTETPPDFSTRAKRLSWRKGILVLVAVPIVILETRGFAAQCWFLRGRGAAHWKAHAEASQLLGRAHALAPWDWHIAYEQGLALTNTHDYPAARNAFRNTLQMNPNYLPALVNLATAELILSGASETSSPQKTEVEEMAMDRLQRALSMCPLDGQANQALGLLLFDRLNSQPQGPEESLLHDAPKSALQDAAEPLQRAVRFSPSATPQVYSALSRIRLALHEDEAAVRMWRTAVRERPGELALWTGFLEFAREAKRFGVLRAEIERTQHQLEGEWGRLSPEQTDLWVRLVLTAAEIDENYANASGRALRTLERAVIRAPARAVLWNALARLAMRRDQVQVLRLALYSVRSAAADSAEPLPIACDAAHSLFEDSGDGLDTAVHLLLQASADENQQPYDVTVGWAAELCVDFIRSSQRATDPVLAAQLGLVCTRAAAWDSAQYLFERYYAKLPPGRPAEFHIPWSQTLVHSHRFDEAITLLKRALEENPGRFDTRLELARMLAKSGQVAEARLHYRMLLRAQGLPPDWKESLTKEFEGLESAPPGPPPTSGND